MATSNANHRKKKSLWNWAPMRAFAKIRQQQFYCVFSIFVQTIDGLPSYMDGLRLLVQIDRKSKRWQTLPSRVFQHVAEFDETLHIETTIFGRKASLQDHRLKFLPKDYILSVVAVDAEEHFLFNQHAIDLSRLLPSYVEGFWEPEKPMSSTASFKLGGKAHGAVLVATFDFEVFNEELRRDALFLTGNASARFGGSSLKRVSRVVKSLPNSPNPSPFVKHANHLFTSPCSSDADSADSACRGTFDLDSSAKETEEWSVYEYCSSDEERFQALKNDPLSLDACEETQVATTPAVRVKSVLGSLDDFGSQVRLANVECVNKINTPVLYSLETDTSCHQSDVQKLQDDSWTDKAQNNLYHGSREIHKLDGFERCPHDIEVTADKFCINIKFAKCSPTSNVSIAEGCEMVNSASFTDDTELPYTCVKSRSVGAYGDAFSLKSFPEESEKDLCNNGAQPFSIEKLECSLNYCEIEKEVCVDVPAPLAEVPMALIWEDGKYEHGLEIPFHVNSEGQGLSASQPKEETDSSLHFQAKVDDNFAAAQTWDNNNGHESSLEVVLEASGDGSTSSLQSKTRALMGFQPHINDGVQVDQSFDSMENFLDTSHYEPVFAALPVYRDTGACLVAQAQVHDAVLVDRCLEDEECEHILTVASHMPVEESDISAPSSRKKLSKVRTPKISQAVCDFRVTVLLLQEDEGNETGIRNSSGVAEDFPSFRARIDTDGSMNAQTQLDVGVQTVLSWEEENDPDKVLEVAGERLGLSNLSPRIGIAEFFQSSAEDDISSEAGVLEDFLIFLEIDKESTWLRVDSPAESARETDDKLIAFANGRQPLCAGQDDNFSFEPFKQHKLFPYSETLQERDCTYRKLGKPFSNHYESEKTCEDDLGLFPIIEAAEIEMRKAAQSLQSKERAKMLDDAEAQALMKEWGLTDEVFERPLRMSRPFSENTLSNSCMVMLKDGGCLKAVGTYGFGCNLMIHVSKPVVIPASASSCVVNVLCSMAEEGLENMTTWALMKMPLQDLDCLSGAHFFRDDGQNSCNLFSWHESFKRLNMDESYTVSRVRNFEGHQSFDMQHLLEKPIAYEDISHAALHIIEPLSLEGLKLQFKQSNEDPGTINSKSVVIQMGMKKQAAENCLKEESLGNSESQVNCSDTASLLDMAVSLEEWLRMSYQVEMLEGELPVSCQESQRQGRSKVNGLQEWATWADHTNDVTLVMRLQLRDPQRYYEPVGASMLALVQMQRSKESNVSSTQQQQWSEHHTNYKSIDSYPETYCGIQFKFTGVHIAGVEQFEGSASEVWGTKKQLQSGSRWLVANSKGIDKRNRSFPASILATYANSDQLWSISLCPCNPGRNCREPEVKFCPHIRNPDIICGK